MTGPERRLPRCEALVKALRHSRTLRDLAPMECGIGWPVPIAVIQDGGPRVFARLPLFVLRPDPAGGADLFTPFATATLDWSSGRLVEYTDLRFKEPHRSRQEWAHPIGRFPHPAVEGLSNAGYRALRTRLFSLYDEFFAAFSLGRQPDAATASGFRELLGRLLEPCLVPSYRRLAPHFSRQYLTGDHLPHEG